MLTYTWWHFDKTQQLGVGPHEAFYTRVTCEKTRLAQKKDVVCRIFMHLTCRARSAASSCVFDLIGLLSFSEHTFLF